MEKETKSYRYYNDTTDLYNDSIALCGYRFNIFFDGKKWAVFTDEPKQITPFRYDGAFSYKEDGWYWDRFYCLIASDSGRFGLLNENGRELTPISYRFPAYAHSDWPDSATFSVSDSAITFYRAPLVNRCLVLQYGAKLGCVDSTGKIVVPFIYDKIFSTHRGMLRGQREGKTCFINTHGKEISGYDLVVPVTENQVFSGLFIVKKGSKYGFVPADDEGILKCMFIIPDDLFYSSATMGHFSIAGEFKKDTYTIDYSNGKLSVHDVDGNDVSEKFRAGKK